ncbi:MAG: isopeptide-forming domain-containing fimbrial protein [Intestinibaculum porci]|uniref:isopeptide-forming domain-containing fimbrial protein n=1 Tax=Intestinibaculum porci TaxID=2487118 RepID=UPI003F1141E3
MKLFKKLLSYIIAFTMVLSLATLLGGNVYAASHKITIDTDKTNHTYEAYRIFKGTYLQKENSEYLGEIDWDTAYVDATNPKSGKTLIDALKEKGEFASVTNAKDVAEELSKNADNSTTAKDFAQIVSKYLKTTTLTSTINAQGKPEITVPAEGYYLVKDKNDNLSTDDNKAYTRIIVKVVGQDVTVAPKTETPTVSKTVQDNDDGDKTTSPARDGHNYGKTADHSIGEVFNYKLVANIPNTNTSVNDYQGAYKLVFHDTMSKGLTYKGVTSVKVSDGTNDGVDVNGYTVTKEDGSPLGDSTPENGLTWKVTIANLKDTKGLDLTRALTVTVIYKAALNENAEIATPAHKLHNDNKVQLEYSNNPNAEGEGTPTGKTTEDTAYVFTYELDNTKVDKVNHDTKLDGAEFQLLKKDNTALKFTYDSGYDSGKGAYRLDPTNTSSDATILVSGHGNTNTNNPTGIFNMIGLDAGEYTLHETKAPDGYNTMADVTITIKADHQLGTTSSSTPSSTPDVTLKFQKGDTTSDENAFLIENGKGSTLPSTGGMGTTLLYVAGGILVACAAAYVVLNKKRA